MRTFVPDRSGFIRAAIRDGNMISASRRAIRAEERRLAALDRMDEAAAGSRPPKATAKRGARSFGFPLK